MAEQSLHILYLPVRPKVLAYLLARIGWVLIALASVPMLVSLYQGVFSITFRYGILLAILALCSAILTRIPAPSDLRVNEGLIVTALAFLISPLIMAYPLSGYGIDYGTALFEAVSAVTTTGLSTLPTVADKPPAFLFARAWMQWYGGLGIVALLPLWLEPGPLPRRLLGLEIDFQPLTTSARYYTWRISQIYLAITSLSFVLLWRLGGDPFAAFVHALAAVSTGGFSSLDNGLDQLGLPFAVGVIAASVSGALPFLIYIRPPNGWWRDPQVRALLITGILGSFLLTGVLVWQQEIPWKMALIHGSITAFSAQSTAGFSTLEIASFPPAALGILLALMLSGGSLGSTGGGVKWLRLLVFWATIKQQVRRLILPPHAWAPIYLGQHTISESLSCRLQALILLYLLTIFVSWIPFLWLQYDPLRSLFEVVSAIATVGLSAGITAADLPPLLKVILGLDMWLGRVEIFAVLVLFSPYNWRLSK